MNTNRQIDFSRYISISYIKELSKVIKSKLKRITLKRNFETVFIIIARTYMCCIL